MARKSKIDELREKFEVALKKGLESESAVERTAAIKATADMLNPNLGELQAQLKQAEDAREAAESALKTAQNALDAANVKIAELEPSALRLPAVEAELADLRTNFDSKIVEARTELVAEAQRHEWAAGRSEHAAKETLMEAQRQFGARGQQILLDEVKRIFEQYNVPEPEDLTKLPTGISPLYLTLFGHTPIKAQLMVGYSKSFPEPNEAFKNTLLSVLRAGLPIYEGMSQSAPIPDLDVKQGVLVSMARKWNVLDEVQRRIDDEAVQRQADFLRNHYAQMHSEEQAAALRGEGRTSIVPEEPVSGVPLSEHLPLCQCGVCSPGRRRTSIEVIEETF